MIALCYHFWMRQVCSHISFSSLACASPRLSQVSTNGASWPKPDRYRGIPAQTKRYPILGSSHSPQAEHRQVMPLPRCLLILRRSLRVYRCTHSHTDTFFPLGTILTKGSPFVLDCLPLFLFSYNPKQRYENYVTGSARPLVCLSAGR